MKTLLVVLLLTISALAGENSPDDWDYASGLYSVNVQDGEDAAVGTIVGPAFPGGIRILRDFRTLNEFKADLIVLVDCLSACHDPHPQLLKPRKIRKR